MNGNKEENGAATEAESVLFEEVVMVGKKEAKPKVGEAGKASQEVEAERIASRQRAHDAKVAKFQAGGEF